MSHLSPIHKKIANPIIIAPMSPFYTRTGDEGTTGLLGEGRVPKFDDRIEALGAVDEATAAIGLARSSAKSPQTAPLLLEAQRDLYKLMAEVGATPENAARFRSIDEARVRWLEEQTDRLEQTTEVPREFIVPGDVPASAALALARTVVRRAERRVVALSQRGGLENPHLLAYLNRLSSLLFMLELVENAYAGQKSNLAKENLA
jgi:cob(I)alamin adenosyltransferase